MVKQILIITVIFLVACNSNDASKSIKADSTQLIKKVDTAKSNPEMTVKNFLKWYKDNHSQISKIDLINSGYENGKFDSSKFYSVNFDSTEKYLQKLKSSSLISDTYINYWRKYFSDCDRNFKKNPQNDGVPDGFDYDFIMNSQDYDEALNQIDKIKIIKSSIKNNKADLIIQLSPETYSDYQLHYYLTNMTGVWLIDSIKNVIK